MTDTSNNETIDTDKEFINYLSGKIESEDRKVAAALLRGLGTAPGTAPEMHKYVLPWLGNNLRPWVEKVYYMVASLYAWHGLAWTPATPDDFSNLGTSLAELKKDENAEALERRFVALLNSHGDDLHVHLRQIVGLLKNIKVNWLRLLKDLKNWNHEDRYVQKKWAQEFWVQKKKQEDAGTTNAQK